METEAACPEHLEVPYAPADRYTGRTEDRQLTLDVFPGAGPGPRPTIVFLHGGGYAEGDKAFGFEEGAMDAARRRGFTVVGVNYLLGRNLFPQVFYDFKRAIRFLRSRANELTIDPERLGVWGFSSGGLLASSTAFSRPGDLFVDESRAVAEDWAVDHPKRLARLGELVARGCGALPMDATAGDLKEYSARVSAVQFDLHHNRDLIRADSPALCTWVGPGGDHAGLRRAAAQAGVAFHAIEVPEPSKRGKPAVHVPNLRQVQKDPWTGEKAQLRDLVIDWSERQLVDAPRALPPEIRPHSRTFARRARVWPVAALDRALVHYTTDGSEPTIDSPIWLTPLEIRETTVIKAIAVAEGMAVSGATTAVFRKGKPPPRITGPEALPPAKVGQPYEVAFRAKAEQIVWTLTPQYRPAHRLHSQGNFRDFTGLAFDPARGVLHGTPRRAGVYTVLVAAARAAGDSAATRTFALVVAE